MRHHASTRLRIATVSDAKRHRDGGGRAEAAHWRGQAHWTGARVGNAGCGDSACASQKALIGAHAPHAKAFTNQRLHKGGEGDEAERTRNRSQSKTRARVEHVFAMVKRLWGFSKARYRGLEKNANRSFVVLGLANLNLGVNARKLRLRQAG